TSVAEFDPAAPYPTPIVLVHGFLGDPGHFRRLRRFLAARGFRNFVTFSYEPRLDYPELARQLQRAIDAVRDDGALELPRELGVVEPRLVGEGDEVPKAARGEEAAESPEMTGVPEETV